MEEVTEFLKGVILTLPYGEVKLHKEGRFTVDAKIREQLNLEQGSTLEQFLVYSRNDKSVVGIFLRPMDEPVLAST